MKNKLNEIINKVDLKIEDLCNQKNNFKYIPGFKLGEEIPYKEDLIDPNDFKRFYEIEGAIDFLKFFKECILLDYDECLNCYKEHYPEDPNLSEYPTHMINGYYKGMFLLKDLL